MLHIGEHLPELLGGGRDDGDEIGFAQAALGGLRVASAWPSAPRPVTARALLGERARLVAA